jgi:hypothetical protein
MSPFWTSLFDHLKDCGRNATLFLITLAGLFGLLLLCTFLDETRLQQFFIPALAVVLVFAFLWLCQAVRRLRQQHWGNLHRGPLSDDEWRVARSKLIKTGRR